VTQAARELFGNNTASTPEPSAWPLQNAVLYTLGWVVITIAVFAHLAVHRYRRAKSKELECSPIDLHRTCHPHTSHPHPQPQPQPQPQRMRRI
jgi:hypothetical protein